MTPPTGTITFLFTDIEGSAKLWEGRPDAMRHALARHDELLRDAISRHNGALFKTMGDAVFAAFTTATDAVGAALDAQYALREEAWTDGIALQVRMGIHTGAAELRDNDYFGRTLNRIARILAAAHGGQVLISEASQDLMRESLPAGASLKSLGAHRLKDLGRPETIFQLQHPRLAGEFPPLRTLDNPSLPNNLPRQLTSFVGRECEVAAVNALLDKTRLLTLTGSGGCGKTRLALQVAADRLEGNTDGVWLVELASVGDPSLVVQAVAGVLSVPERQKKTLVHALTDYLKSKRLLLVLDNCEHVLDACAHVADALLRNCSDIRILATSREGLGIAGEQSYRVPSLSLPDLSLPVTADTLCACEAVRLFAERALFHQPAFAITDANASAVASVCRRLDGIPFAIELAAARLRSLAVEEINGRLDNRFRLLTGGCRTALPRQQTLRALIDWSYDLLNAQEKIVLHRLSVFVGPWMLAAAEQVCADETIDEWEVLDLLTSLVGKSLVVTEQTVGQTRYRLLETVRQYAVDKLLETGEGDVLRARHLAYFLALAEEAEDRIKREGQEEWLNRLDAEHDNLRAALVWCNSVSKENGTELNGSGLDVSELDVSKPAVGGFAEAGLRLAAALGAFWSVRGYYTEGRARLREALNYPDARANTRRRAKALAVAGRLAERQSDYQQAHVLLEESLAMSRALGDEEITAYALASLGVVAHARGDETETRALQEESLRMRRALGDRHGAAYSLTSLGIASCAQGDYTSARRLLEESLAIQQELGDRHGAAYSLANLGAVIYYQGDHTRARDLFEECLAIRRGLGNRLGLAQSLHDLGFVALARRDYVAARSLFEESLQIKRDLGDRHGITFSLGGLASVAAGEHAYVAARTLHDECLTIQRELEDRQGIAYSLANLSRIAHLLGEIASARSLLGESLTMRRSLNDRLGIADSLEAYADLAATESQHAGAARFWGAASALREAIGALMESEVRQEYDEKVRISREAMGTAQFEALFNEGRGWTIDAACDYAMGEQAI